MGRIIVPVLIGVVGVAILVALGTWQVQRLAWKEEMLAEIEARIGDDPSALPANPDPEADKYLPVRATGEVRGEELHLLTTMSGRPAFQIVSLFVTDDGRRVLLERGVVPEGEKNAARETGAVDVVGNLHWPNETGPFTPEPDMGANIWFARDVAAMARALATEEVLIVAREVTPAAAGITQRPVGVEGIPNNHLQYAMTWFGLAIVWAAMTVFWVVRLRRGREERA